MYQNLTSTVESRGITVSKVVFRGFIAPARLQKMHDDAIERRTRLVLERESELQEQKLTDERLAKEEEREKTKRAMESSKAEHRARLQRNEFEASQREKKEVAEQEMSDQTTRQESERTHIKELQLSLGLQPSDVASLLI